MQIYIDTCVLPRCRLEEGRLYRERFGEQLGFELLLMFDIPDFEANLKQNRAMLEAGPLIFHEPGGRKTVRLRIRLDGKKAVGNHSRGGAERSADPADH